MQKSLLCASLWLALAAGLVGCASSPGTRLTPDPFITEARGTGRSQSHLVSRAAVHLKGSHPARKLRSFPQASGVPTAAVQKTSDAEAPEPRPNSAEWWRRENARVGKAIVICRVCLTQASAPDMLSAPKKLPTEVSSNGPK